MTDYGHDLLFGTFPTPTNQQPQHAVDLAVRTEAAGLDLVSFQDHPYQSAFLDTWTLLSYVAARTTRIRLATNVVSLPLRPPAVLARAAASLDLLSDGRVELGLGTGAFWDGIVAMGGPRRRPGEAVQALEEAIAVIRGIWDADERAALRVDGEHYQVAGAKRGPAPAHDIGIWVGAYKPRMLRLIGRLADGWLPSEGYLSSDRDLAEGNATIDRAAEAAGRAPQAIRRLLNISGPQGDTGAWVRRLTDLALEHGISTFILPGDDPRLIDRFGHDVAPAVRELVEQARDDRPGGDDGPGGDGPGGDGPGGDGGPGGAQGPDDNPDPRPGAAGSAVAPTTPGTTATPRAGDPATGGSEYDRLGVYPTPDDGTRASSSAYWDESTRPRRPESGPEVTYTTQGRAVGKHLIDVHDMLRQELEQVRQVITQVKELTLDVASARSALNEMTMRQNDWTLGVYCARYCTTVTQHHSLEDASVFPHLRSAEPGLAPVLDRLQEEHLVIHDVIEQVDRALVTFVSEPEDFTALDEAVDALSDTLLSHLSYEEEQLVEPLARVGLYAGQL